MAKCGQGRRTGEKQAITDSPDLSEFILVKKKSFLERERSKSRRKYAFINRVAFAEGR